MTKINGNSDNDNKVKQFYHLFLYSQNFFMIDYFFMKRWSINFHLFENFKSLGFGSWEYYWPLDYKCCIWILEVKDLLKDSYGLKHQ